MDVRENLRIGGNIYEQPLRVCYYARVSTDHELQATSIVNQVDYFVQYIKSNKPWIFVGGYIDEGISGKEVKRREQFLKMIEDGKEKKFDLVLTKSVSRFARNTIDSIWYTNLLLEYGIGVMFINDNINTFYSDSEFRLTLMASIAQDEIRKLSENVQFGLRQSIERGVVLGNSNILGYVKEKGKLVIVPEEAEIVQEIFSLFQTEKYSYLEVGRKIYQKYHKNLDSTGIKRVLENPKYKGYYCGRKSRVIDYKHSKRKQMIPEEWVTYRNEEAVPAIIEENLWNHVQKIIQQRKKERARGNKKREESKKWTITCQLHHKELKFQQKYYKDKCYGYFVCPKCIRLPYRTLERIYQIVPFTEVTVIPGEEMILICKRQ